MVNPQIENGYIKLYRKSLDSKVFKNDGLWRVWSWCLMKANYKEVWIPVMTGRGFTEVHLLPGQFLYGRKSAARELGMKESSVRNRIEKLKKMQNIDVKVDTHYSIITIINWDIYQGENEKEDRQEDRQRTGKGQAKDTDKNDKKDKNKEKDPPSSNNIPYQEIVDLYHEILPELPRVKILTPTRKSQIKARWLSKYKLSDGTPIDTLDFWKGYFEFVSRSKFLMGQNDRNWKPDLEWLTKESKFAGVIEGKHH